ncbi:MAG: hypothetical protein GWO04_47400, partial [Actinobacteria bacterium]|nr:hypothetical protein [Actinomycetota bacterium]
MHNAIFDDDHPRRVALSHYGLGFRYVDLHRPSMPVELGGYDTTPDANAGFIGAWGVYPRDPR